MLDGQKFLWLENELDPNNLAFEFSKGLHEKERLKHRLEFMLKVG